MIVYWKILWELLSESIVLTMARGNFSLLPIPYLRERICRKAAGLFLLSFRNSRTKTVCIIRHLMRDEAGNG